ncbi:MAG: hypothetical protein WD673_09435 [Alphaproteobacteria bacterium]
MQRLEALAKQRLDFARGVAREQPARESPGDGDGEARRPPAPPWTAAA